MSNIYDVAEIVNWFQQTFRQKSYFMDKICQIFNFFIFYFQPNYVYITFQLINKSDNGNHRGDCRYSCDRSVGDIHWSYSKFAEET